VRIDSTHRKWLIFSLLVLVASTGAYVFYVMHAPHGPSGSSIFGLIFGSVGFAFMILAGLLGARKKVPVWRLGRAQAWMRGHLWLGLLSLPLILFHGGFRFGGVMTSVLMILLITVVASGVFGAVLQHYMPPAMTSDVPLETIFDQINRVRGQLLEEADEFVEGVTAPGGLLATAAVSRAAAIATEELATISEADVAPLRKFYEREMRPFLEKPDSSGHALADSSKAHAMFIGLQTLLPPEVHETVKDLAAICEEERQLRLQARMHRWLHGWLILHIPLSLALLLLGAVHAVMALRF
jgi:hypothetical protein